MEQSKIVEIFGGKDPNSGRNVYSIRDFEYCGKNWEYYFYSRVLLVPKGSEGELSEKVIDAYYSSSTPDELEAVIRNIKGVKFLENAIFSGSEKVH